MASKTTASIALSGLMIVSFVMPALADPAAFLPPGKVCEPGSDGASYIDRHKLMNWAVTQTWEDRVIPQDVWDLNRDGDLTYDEKLGVLSDLEVYQICTSGKCTEGDPEAINAMRYRFRKAFNPKHQSRYLVVTQKGQPDEAWRDEEADLRTVFDYKRVNLRIKCLRKYEADKVVFDIKPQAVGADRENHSGFRVALNRDDLGTERNKLRDLVPAKFSVTDDREKDEWTWAVEGYAGYRYEWASDETGTFGDVIPFAHVVQKSSDNDEDDIDKLGLGLDTAFHRLGFGSVQGGIEYLTDSEAKLDILGGQLIWLPPFGSGRPHIGHFSEIGTTDIEMKIRTRLALHGGRIFDRGSVETISSKSDYLRGGPGLRIQLRGVDGSSFEDFEFSADAKYLFGIAGDKDDYYRLESSLNYFFPGQDHFSLGLSYTYGYQDETLEKEDLIEAVLGARF